MIIFSVVLMMGKSNYLILIPNPINMNYNGNMETKLNRFVQCPMVLVLFRLEELMLIFSFVINNKKFFFCRQKCGISEITKHQFFQQIIIKNH